MHTLLEILRWLDPPAKGIAVGFWAAAMPWIANVVLPAVMGWLGHNQAKKNAKDAKKQSQGLIDAQMDQLKTLKPYGERLLGQGTTNLEQVQSYLRPLVSGDRAAMEQAAAPEINSIAEQQQGSLNTQRNLYPRGGMGAAMTADQPRQLQGDITNFLFGARRSGAEALGTLGGNMASLGLGAMGQGSGLTNSMLEYGLNARNQQFNQESAIGNGVMNGILLGRMLMPSGGSQKPTLPATTNYSSPSPAQGFGSSRLGYPGQSPYNNSFFPSSSMTLGGGSNPSSNSYDNYLQAPKGFLGLRST
jgi:hypothetical protein